MAHFLVTKPSYHHRGLINFLGIPLKLKPNQLLKIDHISLKHELLF